ncbi:LCP family protein [Streptomyces sp. NBC_00239]|uniref:LCP family protein n=1 Tax=Streptomyces sp. NBC_00239 TaxID=2903640 RepID=UPI002E2AC42D|nr:LytR C-terminal domain-containing protein [Streptomyces sp. NBC_00239]
MNDRQDPYDPAAGGAYPAEQQLIGYDAYGQPVYGQVPAQPAQQYDAYGYGYDAYGQPVQPQAPGYDPQQYPQPPHEQQYGGQPQGYDTYGGQQDAYGYGYDPAATGTQPAADFTQQQPQHMQQVQQAQAPQWIPQQAAAPDLAEPQAGRSQAGQVPEPRRAADGSGDGPGGEAPDYRTEQFAFIDQPDEDSEDVIDWLKFTESRTERREEARRRGRNRGVALIVVLALFVVGGLGYLWYAGRLPGLGGGSGTTAGAATGPQKRDMIVVHLHNTKKGGTSTALLVDNVTTKKGATVLLPNTLAVSAEDGTATTLGKSVEEDGLGGTRESLDTMLGTRIEGTWRLDTPFLESLVEQVGGIEVDTDTAIPADTKAKIPAVAKGEKQSLSGAMAVAYATHRAPGEPETRQLQRFGTVLYGVLRKIPDDPGAAAVAVETLGQILDPSLTEKDLGGALARLAEHAKIGDYRTEVMPVGDDGTLADKATDTVVKDLLGGAVKAPEAGAIPRVGLKDASGSEKAATSARVALVNGGYTFVDAGKAGSSQSTSQVTYADDAQKAKAAEVAKTLGLPASAVKKAAGKANTDVTVVLGTDYKAP